MMCDNFARGVQQRGLSDRAFGLVFSALFLFIALSPLLHNAQLNWWAILASVMLGVISLIMPALLSLPNKIWSAFGNIMHRLVSLVVLAVLFFGIVTPFGLMMRLLRKDPLRLRREPATATYWIDRSGTPIGDGMQRQY